MTTVPTSKFPELVSGISAIGDAILNQPVVMSKKASRDAHRSRNGVVTTIQYHPAVLQTAIQLAGPTAKELNIAESRLLSYQQDGSILVLNNPK